MIRIDWLLLALLMLAAGAVGFLVGMIFGWKVRDADAEIDRILSAPDVDAGWFAPRAKIVFERGPCGRIVARGVFRGGISKRRASRPTIRTDGGN